MHSVLVIYWTPLKASEYRNSKIANLLLENGAYTDSFDDGGHIPLLRAAENGMEVVVKLLVEHRVKVESADHNGWIPLCWALEGRKVGYEPVYR